MKYVVVYNEHDAHLVSVQEFTDEKAADVEFKKQRDEYGGQGFDISLITEPSLDKLKQHWARYFHEERRVKLETK
jgi:hypothetical protein